MKTKFLTFFLVFTVVLSTIPINTVSVDAGTLPGGKPLSGKTISVMGDSISTYMGWSDANPITDEDCTYRYGEPYYGPVGSDCHNTDLLVEDTWWHQAARELGAEILISNAGNSTGVFYASYPANLDWQHYLQDMLAYKSRPYHLGTKDASPDVIALYIGSNEVGRMKPSDFGSVEGIDFDTLIVDNGDGTYDYGMPSTVAEAYSIMLHKVTVTYPDAEVYCFTVIPNSGGYLSTCNKRLTATIPFNKMLKGVAGHFDAAVVDIYDEFALDPDGDGLATQEDWDTFKTYFAEGPHPNAEGFDIITKRFVDTVYEKSDYITLVETTAGSKEYIDVQVSKDENGMKKTAADYTAESGMIVDYEYASDKNKDTYVEKYSVVSDDETYTAEGGAEKTVYSKTPSAKMDISLTASNDESWEEVFVQSDDEPGRDGDLKSDDEDGVYNYTETKRAKKGRIAVRTREVSVKENVDSTKHNGLDYVRSDTLATPENGMITGKTPVTIPKTEDEVPPIAPGYEYVYIGSDQLSNYWAAYDFDTVQADYPDETPVYEDDQVSLYAGLDHSIFQSRKLMVPKLYLKHKTVDEGKKYPARYESIQQFRLVNKGCKMLTSYCADQKTPAVEGYSYRLVNLEDATYYSVYEARMLRTIANHGYWGTESGIGSLDEVKQMMRDSQQFTEEEIAKMTDGMAMSATQYAIWSFSNIMDEKTFVNVYYADNSGLKLKKDVQEEAKLIFKLYHYLTSLPPTTAKEGRRLSRNVIINEKNFLNRIALEIEGKVKDHPDNLDADPANDVYMTDIFFELSVEPSTENGDDLVLRIEDEEGNCIAVGRVAGELQDGEVQLRCNEDGEYVFPNVNLSEGIESMRFVLSGTQYLGKTPHLLTSEVRDGTPSQTMICVAEGSRDVDVEMDISFELDVEDEVFASFHMWRSEQQKTLPPPVDPPTDPPTDPPENPPADPPKNPPENPAFEFDKDPSKKPPTGTPMEKPDENPPVEEPDIVPPVQPEPDVNEEPQDEPEQKPEEEFQEQPEKQPQVKPQKETEEKEQPKTGDENRLYMYIGFIVIDLSLLVALMVLHRRNKSFIK